MIQDQLRGRSTGDQREVRQSPGSGRGGVFNPLPLGRDERDERIQGIKRQRIEDEALNAYDPKGRRIP